jgi:hypothetical protein
MAKWWLGVALTVGGLAVARPAPAQYLSPGGPGAPAFAAAGSLPPAPVPAGPMVAGPPPAGQPYGPVPPPPGPGCPPDLGPAGGPSIGGPDNAFPEPDCCPHCNERQCYRVDADYLLWWTRSRSLPALVTSGVATDPIPGALGEPGTKTLLEGSSLSNLTQSGVRVTAAAVLDPAEVWAVEGSGFVLEDRNASATFAGTGAPGSAVLAQPFFNATTLTEAANLISFPNLVAGNLTVATSQRFWGADANVRHLYWRSAAYDGRIDLLAGFRYLALEEGLTFDSTTFGLAPGGALTAISEGLQAKNRFYGGQVGVAYEGRVGGVFLDLLGKFAFGENQQMLINNAFTTVIDTTGNIVGIPNSGLYVQPSNAGRFTHEHFSFVPEARFTLGYEFNRNVRIGAGYNLIVWTNVIRPEQQLDRNINLPPSDLAARPTVSFQNTTFWAQGLSLSLQLSF